MLAAVATGWQAYRRPTATPNNSPPASRRHVPPAQVPVLRNSAFDLMTRSAFISQVPTEPKRPTARRDARRIEPFVRRCDCPRRPSRIAAATAEEDAQPAPGGQQEHLIRPAAVRHRHPTGQTERRRNGILPGAGSVRPTTMTAALSISAQPFAFARSMAGFLPQVGCVRVSRRGFPTFLKAVIHFGSITENCYSLTPQPAPGHRCRRAACDCDYAGASAGAEIRRGIPASPAPAHRLRQAVRRSR